MAAMVVRFGQYNVSKTLLGTVSQNVYLPDEKGALTSIVLFRCTWQSLFAPFTLLPFPPLVLLPRKQTWDWEMQQSGGDMRWQAWGPKPVNWEQWSRKADRALVPVSISRQLYQCCTSSPLSSHKIRKRKLSSCELAVTCCCRQVSCYLQPKALLTSQLWDSHILKLFRHVSVNVGLF